MAREDRLVERITYLTKIALGEGLDKDFTEFMLQAAIKAAKVGYSFAVDEACEWLGGNFRVSSFDDTKIVTHFSSMFDVLASFRKAMGED